MCDEPEELKRKAAELAAAVRSARHLVIYTGAGISTVRLESSSWSPCKGSVVWTVAWLLNDHRTCVTSLGCCTSPVASTISRLHLGVIPAAQEILRLHCLRPSAGHCSCLTQVSSMTWCKTLSQLAQEQYMCYQTCRNSWRLLEFTNSSLRIVLLQRPGAKQQSGSTSSKVTSVTFV